MKYEGMSAVEANDLIKKSRPEADPYWGALQEYSKKYLSSNKNDTSPSASSGLRTTSISESKGKTIPNVQWRDEDQS